MIYSKSNLQVVNVTSKDRDINVLSHVHFGADGHTAGIDGRAVMIVEPAPVEYRQHFVVPSINNGAFAIPASGVKEVIKNIPPDTRFKGLLEQTAITKDDEAGVEFTTTDGQQVKKVQVRKHRKPFPDVKAMLSAVYRKDTARVCVNRTRLIKLLMAIDKACPDPSNENPVFIELAKDSGEIVIRAKNMKTGQIAIGLMTQYEGEWLKRSRWEKEVTE